MDNLSSKDLTLSEITTYQAGVLQSSAYRVLKKFTDACLKDHGLSTMQWFLIGTIYDTGEAGIRIIELCKLMDTNMPYITNSLNVLESKGIVERLNLKGDGRGKRVCVTKEFIQKCPKIEADLRKKMRTGIYAKIDPEQLQNYLQVLQKLNSLTDGE